MADEGKVVVLGQVPPSVVFCPHPLMPARDRRLVFEAPRPDETLDAYLSRVIGRLPQPCVVTIGDRVIPRGWWGRVRVKPGTVVQVAAAVEGGDGSDVGRVLLTIALIVASVYLGPGLGAFLNEGIGLGLTGAQAAAMGMAVVSTFGTLAINALLPPPKPDLSTLSGETVSPTYSLTGGSNQARRYESLPLVIGTHRMFPDAACAAYTLFEGEDQFLYAAYNFGFGDLEITDLRIGDTPLTDYQEVTTAWGDGAWPGLVAGNVDTVAGGGLTVAGGPIQKTTSIYTNEIQIDLQSVIFRAGNGGLEALPTVVRIEYRAVGGGSWLAFLESGATVTLQGGGRKAVRTTYRRTVTSGQYEVRVTKVTADTTDSRATCDIAVSAVRSLQPNTGSYAGQRILALKIRASGQLNGVVSQLSGLVNHRILGETTSNPAKWFKAFALGSFNLRGRLWGAGILLSKLDLAGLEAWATWCDTKGLSCNLVIDSAASCATVLDRIARCGRGSKTWAPGLLSAVWDADGLPVTAMFSPVNIRRGSFGISYPSEALADELEVSYINPDNNWQRDTVRVPPDATNVARTAQVELLGCTDTALAGKEANLLYAQNLYRFRTISWEADIEGLTVKKGDVVSLSHDLTRWGQAGRLVTVESSTALTLDRAITLKPSGCWMAVCRPSGEISYHRVQVGTTEDESDVVTLLDPLPTTPAADGSLAVDWRYTADAKATPGWRVKITEIAPLPGMDGVQIIAQDDPAEYYAAESGTFTHVATPVTNSMPVLSGLVVAEELIRAGTGYAVQLHLAWSAQGDVAATVVRYQIDSGPWLEGGFASGTRHALLLPENGTVAVAVTGFNGLGQSHPGSRLTATHVIAGQTVPPPNVTGFSVSDAGTRVFIWTVDSVPPDVTYLEIRYAADSGTAWAVMTTLGRVPYGAGRGESGLPAAGTWTFEARMLDASGNFSSSGPRATVTLAAPPESVTNTNQLIDGAGLGLTAVWSHVSGSGKPEDDATVGATWGTNLFNVPYDKILSTDAASTLGFNPSFEAWADPDAAPDGWTIWSFGDGTAPVKETGIVRAGSNSAKYVCAGVRKGMYRQSMWVNAPLPAGTFIAGTLDMYLGASMSGLPGAVVFLWTNAAGTTNVATYVHPENIVGSWQRLPFTARVGAGQRIYGMSIYLLGCYEQEGFSPFTGTVYFDGLSFGFFDASVDNKSISIGADGTLSGGGGGSVTITGLGYTGDLNATNGAPSGTYVGSASADTLVSDAATAKANASTALANASAAQSSADSANTLLADISSDAKLTAAEKPKVRREWDVVAAEKAGINASAAALSITTENTSYNAAFQALATYLNDGASWSSGVPAWISDANLATTTNVVGATFRATWAAYYAARQTVLNKIASEASKTATWALVGGSGKPQDNATVGATVGSDLTTSGGVTISAVVSDQSPLTTANQATFISSLQIGNGSTSNIVINTAQLALDAMGNAEFKGTLTAASGTFSGTLTADAINAVSTINIGLDQVTVPRSAYTLGAQAINGTFSDIQSAYIDADGATVVVLGISVCTAKVTNSSTDVNFRLLAPSGEVLASAAVLISEFSGVTRTRHVSLAGVSTEVGLYRLQAASSLSSPKCSSRLLLLLGAKR